MRQCCIHSPHPFNVYSQSVIEEAEIEEIGIKIGGTFASNVSYADATVLCAESQKRLKD